MPPGLETIEITPDAAAAWLAEAAEVQLIDCREADEWELCRIDGAVLVPLSEFGVVAPGRVDSNRPVIVYCHHGMRSLRAAAWLRHRGVAAWSLAGGIEAWSEQVDPEVPRY